MNEDRPTRPEDENPESADNDKPESQDTDSGQDKPSGPAPWEHGESREAPDVDETREGEAEYLADDQMSLGSKLRGGGRDLGGEAPGENMRLCPACGRVTSFIDDTCSNCKHKLGTGGYEDVQEIRGMATGQTELPLTRILLIALIAIIVIVILVIALPRIFSGPSNSPAEEPAQPAATTASGGFAGQLDEVEVDDAFKERLVAAVRAGNAGWERANVDAYVYRINTSNQVEPAQSQQIFVVGYVGGEDHQEAIAGTGDVPFRTGIAPLFDEINSRAGVEMNIVLEYTGGEDVPARDDIYLRYGYYYGKEHMDELQPIMKALETYKINNGDYPGQLSQSMLPSTLNTRGGLFFIPGGIGYLPIYKTDSNGNIIMGSGGGIDNFTPEECTGYYLVKYTRKEDNGIDLYGEEEMEYYIEHIAPFPYDPTGQVRNMVLVPDGQPDGIACVIKNGVLQGG